MIVYVQAVLKVVIARLIRMSVQIHRAIIMVPVWIFWVILHASVKENGREKPARLVS